MLNLRHETLVSRKTTWKKNWKNKCSEWKGRTHTKVKMKIDNCTSISVIEESVFALLIFTIQAWKCVQTSYSCRVFTFTPWYIIRAVKQSYLSTNLTKIQFFNNPSMVISNFNFDDKQMEMNTKIEWFYVWWLGFPKASGLHKN